MNPTPELLEALSYIDQQADLAMAAPSLAEVDVYLDRIRTAARAAMVKAKGEPA